MELVSHPLVLSLTALLAAIFLAGGPSRDDD
ncbi:MAG: hypothetical protein RL696_432 [Actinomycetota bacterium]